jgi:DNA (cytosine-5)-methyltransferase 1
MKSLKTIDLFAGGGGLSLGFLKAGFDIVAAFENWQPAIDLYMANFNHNILSFDLSKDNVIDPIASYNPDIIIGGPPCQDFSSAGKRDETLGRADLTISFTSIIGKLKPKYFVMENVDRALKSNAMNFAMEQFRQHGYGLTIKVLNASFCGVPQNRKRLFIIGSLGTEDNFLDTCIEQKLSNNAMTIREYVGTSFGLEHYYRHPRSYKRRGIFSIDEPSPTVRGVNRPVPKGYPGHPGDTAPISNNLRPLTTRERSIIQTYPENFQLIGTKTDVEQIIGNAVPVNLAKFVAESLIDYINVENKKILTTLAFA